MRLEILNQVQDDGELRVRIRHGGELLRAKVESQKLESKSDQPILRVVLEEPVFGVAPGQAAVFYAGAVVVGGGVIR